MRASFLIVLGGLCLVGCQPRPEVVGKWKYGIDTIEFKDDHTFLQKDHKGDVEGMWFRMNDIVTLTPETVSSQPVEKVRPRILKLAKTPDQKKKLDLVLEQWLGVDRFKIDPSGLTMDIVDPSGKRKDSMMRTK